MPLVSPRVVSVGSSLPSPVVTAARGNARSRFRINASAHFQAQSITGGRALPGPSWRAGLADWLHSQKASAYAEQRTELELAPEGLTQWLFRELSPESGPAGSHSLKAYPLQVMAALLAPMAGIDLAQGEGWIQSVVTQASPHPELPWLTPTVVEKLLNTLFGADVVRHEPGFKPLPEDMHDLRFWAAMGEGGKLWVSDARWGEAGGFMLEYPHTGQTHSLFGGENPPHRVIWDGNFERFFQQGEPPTVLTWSKPVSEDTTAPWASEPRHTASSFMDLLTSVKFEPVNLVPSPNSTRWPDAVRVSVVNRLQRRGYGFTQQRSELLCHSEAWLSGLRFEAMRRSEIGPTGPLDAAEMLSVLSTSARQCPIENRLLDLLRQVENLAITRTQLNKLKEGEWLLGVLEDLLHAKCQKAYCTTAAHDFARRALPSSDSKLRVWMSQGGSLTGDTLPMPIRQLNIHACGPMFGSMPLTLKRDFVEGAGWVGRGMQVVIGEVPPPMPPGTRHLVFQLTDVNDPHTPMGLEGRAHVQRAFWNAVLDFNDEPGAAAVALRRG